MNKYIPIYGFVFFCLTISTSFATQVNLNFTTNKWINPVAGNMHTDTSYDYLSDTYENNFNKQHVGTDIPAPLNAPVYAIADGQVTHIDRRNDETGNLSKIYILHETSERIVFTAVYGHCKAVSDLSVDDRVVAGEKIGLITRFGRPDHLHFGINETDSLSISGWGRQPIDSNVNELGWRNPVDFLSDHSPISFKWEGTGSLISKEISNKNCFGCNQDQVIIHPGSNKKSIASFQWQVSDSCDAIQLSTNADNTLSNEVNIRLGLWNKRHQDIVFSNIQLPFVLDRNNMNLPFKSGYYYTIHVAFDHVIENETYLYARCTGQPGDETQPAERYSTIDFDGLMQTSNLYFQWTGNGSIISQEGSSKNGWGCQKDEARILPVSENILPEIYYQWQASEACRSLRISSGPSAKKQDSKPSVEILVKPWNFDTEDCEEGKHSKCGLIKTRLPYTIKDQYVPENGFYNVIRIRFLESVSQRQSVIAQCPGSW